MCFISQLIIVVKYLSKAVRSQVGPETGRKKGIIFITKFRKPNLRDTGTTQWARCWEEALVDTLRHTPKMVKTWTWFHCVCVHMCACLYVGVWICDWSQRPS